MDRQALNDFIDTKLKEANKLISLNSIPAVLRQKIMERPSDAPDRAIALATETLQQAGLSEHPMAFRMGLEVLARSAYPAGR